MGEWIDIVTSLWVRLDGKMAVDIDGQYRNVD